MENLHKNNALALEHMRQAIHNAGGRFYQYRPCRRDASTVYDIENIRHDVVYAQTPLNMNDPFDSMIGFSAEKIYSECTTMVLDAMDLAGANRVVISMLLQYRAFRKMAQLFPICAAKINAGNMKMNGELLILERKTPRSSLNCHALNLLHSGRTLIACANDYYLRFVKARAFRAMICA